MTEKLRLGVFGGSFDPVHLGHLKAAESAKSSLQLNKVLFVPAGHQWQKTGSASSADRLAMLQLALNGHKGLEVSTVDIDRDGPTYTVDTLQDLAEAYPQSELFFLLGTDAFAGLDTWHRADELFKFATLVVINRPGVPVSVPRVAEGKPSGYLVLDLPTIDLSSTEFRQKYGLDLDCSGLLDPDVLTYIREHGLYREHQDHDRQTAN